MKRSPKFFSLALMAAASVATLGAQSVFTDPVGFITIPAKGGSTGTPATTFIALSMVRPVSYQTVVPSASGQGASLVSGATVITFPAGSFTVGQFGPGPSAAPNFYLELLNGPSAGASSQVTATSTNSITLHDDLSQGITNGTTTFRIRPNWTFGTAFGNTNQAGFLGASSSADADLIQSIDPLTNVATSYFYNTSTTRWEKSDNTDATDVPISYEAGLQVVRKGTGDLNFKLAGAIKTGPSGLYVTGSANGNTFNLLGNPYPMESVLLKDVGLYTGDPATGVVGGISGNAASTTDADVVRIYDFAHDQFNDFYFNTATSRWTTGTTDASAFVIPAGASVSVIRKAGRPSLLWYAPQPGMVLGDVPLLLTLVSASSRKTHTGFGVADVNIPLSGVLGIESRNPGLNNTHTLVFNFSNYVTGGTAVVTSGNGSVASTSFSGKTMTVNLTGVGEAQAMTIGLSNIIDSQSQNLPSANVSLKFVAADINSSSNTNAGDVTITKANASLGGFLNLGNFRADVNTDGVINSGDVTIAKARASLGVVVP